VTNQNKKTAAMDPDHNGDYEEGMRDGRLLALEHRMKEHDVKVSSHERRLAYLERIVAGFLAIVFLSTIWPKLEVLLSAMADK